MQSTSSRKSLARAARNAGSSQRCSPCPSKGNDGEQQHRHHEAFESGNARDVYSSVSHLKGNLDSLSFAIGLREEGGREGALERLLPMLKIRPRPNEPGRRGDKASRGFAECEHPDCIAREEKIKKLKELIEKENDGLERLESEIESLNARHARAVVEMETLDDRIDTSMAKRVEIDAQNEELQLILDEAEARKSHLQEQADVLKNEIADLTRKLETRDKELRDQERRQEMLDSVRMVFQRESPHEAASEEVRSVRALPDAPCEPS
ncbi:unnamed protein product [Ascophyllum nodosum]